MGFASVESVSASPGQEPCQTDNTKQLAQTVVVGLVGMTCSGKSTSAPVLSNLLNGREVPVLSQDDFFFFEQYKTDACPRKDFGSRAWKDWETPNSVDWPAFAAAIERATAESTSPYLVVEGFQLCARSEIVSLLDVAVALDLSKADCWFRRKARALSMRDLPSGLGDGMNYEVLETYIFGESPEAKSAAQGTVRAAAAASMVCAEEGDDAWMRLYFEEMVWPEAERQREDIRKCTIPMLSLDASEPPGEAEWLRKKMPEAALFVHETVRPVQRQGVAADP